MANDGVLIESISEQAFKNVDDFVKRLEDGIDTVNKLEKSFKTVASPSGVNKAAKDVEKNFKSISKAQSDYEKNLKKLSNTEKRRMLAMTQQGKQIIKNRTEVNKLNAAERISVKIVSNVFGAYDQLDAALSKVSAQYRNLAVKKELQGELSAKESRRMERLGALTTKYYNILSAADAKTGKFTRNVGNYKSGFDGLGFSIAQLSREIPAFANSMQTGFMAISNNIPMLVDEITRLKTANVELAKSGQPTVNILKRVGKSIISLNGLLGIGITVLTIFGPKLIAWATGMSAAEKATEKANKELEEQNEQIRENIRLRNQQIKDVKGFLNSSEITEEFAGLLKGTIQESDRAGLALIELGERLESFGVKNAELLKDENILQGDRTRIAINLIEIEKQRVKLTEERVRLDDEIKKKNEINLKFKNGEISAEQQKFELSKLGRTSLNETLKIQGRINQLSSENNTIAEKYAELTNKGRDGKEKDLDFLKGSIAFFEALIAKQVELRDKTATTNDEYEEFNRNIALLRHEINLLNGEYARYLNQLKEGIKLKEDMTDEIDANTEALEKENEALQRQQAIENQKAQEELEANALLKKSFVAIGNTLGIQEKTVSDLFDSFKDGFADAGEAAQQFGALFNDVIGAMSRAENARIEERIQDLQREKEIAIAFAGESAEGRAEVEKRFRQKEKELRNRQLKNEKDAALFQSIINTAVSVVEALPNIPLSIAVGILGAANTALIAATKIPQFKDGVRGFKGGKAILGDGGEHEPYTDGQGRLLGISPDTPTLVDLPAGANVYKDFGDFNKELNGVLGVNNINPLGSAVYGNIPKSSLNNNYGIDESAMERVMRKTLANQPKYDINIDKNGMRTFVSHQKTRTERQNNRQTMKGIDL